MQSTFQMTTFEKHIRCFRWKIMYCWFSGFVLRLLVIAVVIVPQYMQGACIRESIYVLFDNKCFFKLFICVSFLVIDYSQLFVACGIALPMWRFGWTGYNVKWVHFGTWYTCKWIRKSFDVWHSYWNVSFTNIQYTRWLGNRHLRPHS